MASPIEHKAIKESGDPKTLTLKISLCREGIDVGGPVTISTKEASQIAAVVLGHATLAYDQSGKPPPYKGTEGKVDLTVVSPSGLGIGPGRKLGKTIMMIHFGDATLGVEFPNPELRRFAQQLLTTAADEASRQ
jgi:hypothetical protein